MALFILDSNVFIQAWRLTYPIDVVPNFWKKLRALAQSGHIISIDKVKDELYKNSDGLKTWCMENLPPEFFKDTTEVIEAYIKVSGWISEKQNHYKQAAIDEFLRHDEADAFLVAYTLADRENRKIVTYEVSSQGRKKVKISDCAGDLGVDYMNTIEMFRALKETF
ncbi:PIN domain protein [Chloroherpeton thalassium ATCC 35110]|uniref:PIN domain protein n=1 Tax=Chloroherpeton thalassium (strain ATCC 35110 / GB-78) TaxID=517418 RepID=B3QS83_CHLT3|nr:DUF4411 family protein [Chloroherpeton thalassium]ACF14028.1 PIN domain protein [Chloroherpeton thalassium ATCC 35110]